MKPLQHKRETNVMKNDEDGTWKTETRTERGKNPWKMIVFAMRSLGR